MNFKKWLANLEEGIFCSKGRCADPNTPRKYPPKKPHPSPKDFYGPKPHDLGRPSGLGGGAMPGGAMGGGGAAPAAGQGGQMPTK